MPLKKNQTDTRTPESRSANQESAHREEANKRKSQSTPNETATQRKKPPEGWDALGQCEPQEKKHHASTKGATHVHKQPKAAAPRNREGYLHEKGSLRHENSQTATAPTQSQTQLTKSGCSPKTKTKGTSC